MIHTHTNINFFEYIEYIILLLEPSSVLCQDSTIYIFRLDNWQLFQLPQNVHAAFNGFVAKSLAKILLFHVLLLNLELYTRYCFAILSELREMRERKANCANPSLMSFRLFTSWNICFKKELSLPTIQCMCRGWCQCRYRENSLEQFASEDIWQDKNKQHSWQVLSAWR
jgi:hypothetical protein